ncbi:cancer-associated gene 1 protein isoform X2 [Sphaerodactylus townsendi]|uniref:cancer-associated gene 1 protein isoform X2 n=1 Tax=Sphaerodactylus townsendi TaxID=933632 RepID=UPI0020261663|nr:cancer-associated gene 1 protein isoform X2 [Sphaerodactylus townsendi]
MSEADIISISCVSLELIHKDSLNAESCSTALDTSQDEMLGTRMRSECDHTLYKGDHLSEPLFEDFLYDSEDASEKLMTPLNTLRTCPVDKDCSYTSEWKDSNEELSSQEEATQQCRILDKQKESCGMAKDHGQEAAWELTTEEALPGKDLFLDTLAMPTQEDPLVIMGESLLDSIVKDSPIKEVSSFLTQPTSSLLKTEESFADEDFPITSEVSNVAEKTSDQDGNVVDTEQPTKSADAGLTVSPDTLDENVNYICTLMQSNRHLKERLKRNLAYCTNQEEAVSSPSPPESVGTVSKREHKAEKKLTPLQAEMAKDCRQGDVGDQGISPSHVTRSCCLNPYEASLKLYERNTLEFSSKQLLLQEGDMDFYGTINGLGHNQQQQLTHILDLQHCSVVLEKKISEMETLLLQEGDMGWDKAIQELKQDQKKQQTQIMDLYYDAVSMGTRVKELEVDVLKQRDFFDTINTLKRTVADLTEAKNRATEEKDRAESFLKSREEAFASTNGHLQDVEAERSTLMLQLKKFKADVSAFQGKLQEEMEQKAKYMDQCVELDSIFHRKEQEIQELRNIKHQLEQEVGGTVSALQKMKEEKHTLEKHVKSLQAVLQRQKDERRAERKRLGSRYNKLVAQIKILQVQSENEQAEMEKMQQQVHMFRMENDGLQQQVAKGKNENQLLQAESARWKEQCDQIRESQTLKEKMQYQIIEVLSYKLQLQQEELRKKEEIIAWKMHILGRLHLDMKSVQSDLSTRSLHTEENHSNSPYVQKASNLLTKIRSLLALTEGLLTCQDSKTVADSSKKSQTGIEQNEETKSFSIKNKTKKHKKNSAATRELIIKERSSEGHHSLLTGTGQEESPHGSDDLPDLLRTKLRENHNLTDDNWSVFKDLETNLASKEEQCKTVTGDNRKLQNDFGSLACKASGAFQQFHHIYHGTQRLHSLPNGYGRF